MKILHTTRMVVKTSQGHKLVWMIVADLPNKLPLLNIEAMVVLGVIHPDFPNFNFYQDIEKRKLKRTTTF